MSLFAELKRRNVFRVGIAYVIVAWLVLQVADVVLNNIAAPEWVFKTILLVLIIGLPVVLVFAWAFELTPEGLKRDKDVDRSASIAPQTGRRLDRIIIGVLVLALAYFAFDKFALESLPEGMAIQQAEVQPQPNAAPAISPAAGSRSRIPSRCTSSASSRRISPTRAPPRWPWWRHRARTRRSTT